MLMNVKAGTLKAIASLVACMPRGRDKGFTPVLGMVRIGDGYAVATDRHIMGAIRVPEFDGVDGEILLSEAVLKVLGTVKGSVMFDTETRVFVVIGTGVTLQAEPEGLYQYPQVLKLVLETRTGGVRATDWSMNPALLGLLAKLKDPTSGKVLDSMRLYAPRVDGDVLGAVIAESRLETEDGIPVVRVLMMPQNH